MTGIADDDLTDRKSGTSLAQEEDGCRSQSALLGQPKRSNLALGDQAIWGMSGK
jgi:hypothetical protein